MTVDAHWLPPGWATQAWCSVAYLPEKCQNYNMDACQEIASELMHRLDSGWTRAHTPVPNTMFFKLGKVWLFLGVFEVNQGYLWFVKVQLYYCDSPGVSEEWTFHDIRTPERTTAVTTKAADSVAEWVGHQLPAIREAAG